MPDPADPYPAIAYEVRSEENDDSEYFFCSCINTQKKTCDHLKTLYRLTHAFDRQGQSNGIESFRSSRWHRLATVLGDNCRETVESIQLMQNGAAGDTDLVVTDRSKTPMLVYRSQGEDRIRLISRCTLSADDTTVPTRADILKKLAATTLTASERVLDQKGLKSARQAFETKFWYRFAYHAFREFGEDGCSLHPAIDEIDGEFILSGKDHANQILFYLPVPRNRVKYLLSALKEDLANQHGLAIHPLSLDWVFDVSLNAGMDIEIQPMLRLIQQDGELRLLRRDDLKRFQYGNLYYIKELGVLVEDQYPKISPKFVDPVHTVVQRSQVPQFLAEHGEALKQDLFRLDKQVQRLKIITSFDRLEVSPEAIDRDWCWLSAAYGEGDQKVSLATLLRAKQNGQRFVASASGWIDCHAPEFEFLDELADHVVMDEMNGDNKGLRLSRADLFRLHALHGRTLQVTGEAEKTNTINRLLEMKPTVPPPVVETMTSDLREYQQLGVQWLWFLYENGFGGLLCDDMGLGKTHQVMAFLVGLQERRQSDLPSIIVCPTSVISHWERKIAQYVPSIKAVVYYGIQRDLDRVLDQADVLITSYGILWRDMDALMRAKFFEIAVFDEIQHIKNSQTQAHKAARDLKARMKIGLTGTPIENRIAELKALMDLAIPGYLGTDERFARRYIRPIEDQCDPSRKEDLYRLISPFTLRRLKKSVLSELPEKIEDLRVCHLSEEQVKLYRDAIDRRGGELRQTLARDNAAIPYLHVFALLNLLKHICNHPALVHGNPDAYRRHESGKWDLFTELLSEILDSGLKMVVYSQYVGMIEIIKRYLKDQKINFVSLTGASQHRGRIIDRFDKDPDCRVFVGSLRAGGVGIDLVAASVVIHYDRWWNAAREDQATDRVHRIGQRRGVQVFKLVTEGTLEEKIARIIARKRELMDSIVKEDDPALVKSFTRQELIEMLAMPLMASSNRNNRR